MGPDRSTRPLNDGQQPSTCNNDIDYGKVADDMKTTRKGSKKLTDDERATQIAVFQYPEVIKGIAKFQAARANMTDEEKAEEVDDIRKQLGMLPRKKKKPEGPYEVDTTEEVDMT